MTESLHWQATRLRTCLITSWKRVFIEAQKQSQKIYSKVLHQANDRFVRTPCPAVVTSGVATGDLPLASKVLTYPEVRNLPLPPAKNLLVLEDLPQFQLLMRSLFPEDLLCPYQLAGKLKYFRKTWEKLSSEQAVLIMIKIGWPDTLFGSTPSNQMSETSTNVQGEISVSSYSYPLLEKGAIKVIDSSQDKYLSSIFLVKKKDSNQRPFINL